MKSFIFNASTLLNQSKVVPLRFSIVIYIYSSSFIKLDLGVTLIL